MRTLKYVLSTIFADADGEVKCIVGCRAVLSLHKSHVIHRKMSRASTHASTWQYVHTLNWTSTRTSTEDLSGIVKYASDESWHVINVSLHVLLPCLQTLQPAVECLRYKLWKMLLLMSSYNILPLPTWAAIILSSPLSHLLGPVSLSYSSQACSILSLSEIP